MGNTNTTANDDIDQKVCDKYKKGDKKEDHEKVIKCEGLPNRKRNTSSLRLNLKKSYDSKQLYTNRPFTAPSYSLALSKTSSTPTPCSALRPSLSLHNLESKTFTNVLIPSVKASVGHEVSLSPINKSTEEKQKKKISIVYFKGHNEKRLDNDNDNILPTSTSIHQHPLLQSCISMPSL